MKNASKINMLRIPRPKSKSQLILLAFFIVNNYRSKWTISWTFWFWFCCRRWYCPGYRPSYRRRYLRLGMIFWYAFTVVINCWFMATFLGFLLWTIIIFRTFGTVWNVANAFEVVTTCISFEFTSCVFVNLNLFCFSLLVFHYFPQKIRKFWKFEIFVV